MCVFAGSSEGARPAYREAARRLGALLAGAGTDVVYGGGAVGLMGAVADGAIDAGGDVVGVIPRALVAREVAHPRLTDLRVVTTMHERKATMAELADAFVALPGGLGTLEEILEVTTWAQLGVHRKPVGLLDVEGYYRPLLGALDHAVAEGFLSDRRRGTLLVDADPGALLESLARYEPPHTEKWIDDVRQT